MKAGDTLLFRVPDGYGSPSQVFQVTLPNKQHQALAYTWPQQEEQALYSANDIRRYFEIGAWQEVILWWV